MANPSMYNFFSASHPSASKPTKHAVASATDSSPPRFPCHWPECPKEFATSKARAGHQKAHKCKPAAARQEAKPTEHATAPSTNSSPLRFPCPWPRCPKEFPTSKARATHQKAHKGERAAPAGPNIPANNLQEYPLLHHLFPIHPQQPPLPPHQQHQDQNLASISAPRSFLRLSTADALSTTTDEDDSANMDLTLRL
ncbi:hypothetical protein SLEP1_g48212 [Rubroshorea leprosula]|uniref:C2H2-type domain-containing protein n=1 Tax=Rubroshorea leprosula TaxID=152421 RepID=A0AAV5LTV8_9ROSI|nr:hypothetical protein SLEP1_g48212 [Rubroshorea leprosula]